MRRITIRPFLLGALAVLLALLGQGALRADAAFDAALLFGAAAALFLWALGRRAFFPEEPFVLGEAPLPPRSSRRWWAAGGLLVAAVVLSVLAWRGFDAAHPNSALAWRQHIAAILLALAAAASLDVSPASGASWRSGSAWKWWGLLAAIVLPAAFVRLWRLDSLPFGVWYDEAEYGLQALRILNDPQFRPVFEGAINGPAHYLYLVAGSFDLFGVNVGAVRLVNAVFGVLTVLAGYWVGRELFGRRIGLVLALMLAVSAWLITLSRLGMHSTSTTPFFTLATLLFLLRGQRRGNVFDFALAGLWLGLGLCFYTSFRLFVPVVAIFLLHCALYHWLRSRSLPPPRFLLGVGAMAIAAALVVAPLVWFANKQPDIFWARVQDTFIFTGKSEEERLPALLENIQDHVLMFHWRGDPNGRHNLPGEPMLDNIAAALAVLGVAYSLRRLADPRYALLPLWLGLTLLGGILSLDFEAPQSLRANGTLGAAYVLAVVPLAVLVRAWEVSDGRYLPRLVWWPIGGLLVLSMAANLNTYFVRQASDFATWAAHSTGETLTAGLLNALDENTDAYVTSFYHGHPTLRFLLPTSRPYAELKTTDQLPLDFTPGRGALLVMNVESRAQYDAAKRLYPNAQFEEIMPPMPGPAILYTVRLSPEDVASAQGLEGQYFANAQWEGSPALLRRDRQLDFDWAAAPPIAPPFSIEWNGVLHAANYGIYDLLLQTPGPAEVLIGEQAVLTGTGILSGSLELAEGNHALRIRVQVDADAAAQAPAAPSTDGIFRLSWRTPNGPVEPIGPSALYTAPMTANGLLARYFANGDWEGPGVHARIEDQLGYYVHVPPLPRPYTVEYSGKIAIPTGGEFRFGLESIDESILEINGEEIVRSTQPNQYEEGAVNLEAGLHDIRIRFADRTAHTHLNVYWMPPGAAREIVPPAVLFPPQGSYANVTLPSLESLAAVGAGADAPPPAPQLGGSARIFATGLQQPRGIAVADDGRVFVAEGGGGKITIYSPDGEILGVLPQEAAVLAEPTDVALDAEALYVLDAGGGELWRYALEDGDALAIPADPGLLDRSRGIAMGPDGRVWVAVTTAGFAAAIDPLGGDPSQVSVIVDGAAGQPVDVAVAADGIVFATDASANKLLRMTAAGQPERTWALPPANSLDGPHLAFDAFGFLYVTEPEGGRVEKRDPGGQAVGVWDLAALLNRRIKAVGLDVGPDGRIWVTDSEGGAVVVVEPE